MKSYLISSVAVKDSRPLSISSTSILKTPALKKGFQLLPYVDSTLSLISFRVKVSFSSSALGKQKKENLRLTPQHYILC